MGLKLVSTCKVAEPPCTAALVAVVYYRIRIKDICWGGSNAG